MTSKLLKNIVRVFGLIATVLLIVQPWFYTTGSDDPFLYSSWNILCSGFIGAVLLSVILVFYKPRKTQIPFAMIFFLLFISVIFLAKNSQYLSSLRSSVFVVNTLLLLVFLRLSRFKKDNYALVSVIAVSGAFMGVYSILQSFGYDFFDWNVRYNAVGTLANTNYAGIFMVVSAMVTLGACMDISWEHWRGKLAFLFMLGLQIAGALYCRKLGINLTLGLSLFMFFTVAFFERHPGKYIGRHALLSGFILASTFVGLYGLAYYKINSYSWETVTRSPVNRTTAARFILWKMGFEVFLDNPLLGVGPGALPYEVQIKRLPNADVFGINEYNPDPHAVPIGLLAEFGFWGFWLICSFLCMVFGIYIRKRGRDFRELEIPYTLEIEAEILKTEDGSVLNHGNLLENKPLDDEKTEAVEITDIDEDKETSEAFKSVDANEEVKASVTAKAAEVHDNKEADNSIVDNKVASSEEVDGDIAINGDSEINETTEPPVIKKSKVKKPRVKSRWELPWFLTFLILLILYLGYRSGFVSMPVAFYSLPFVVAFTGVFNLFTRGEEDDFTSRYQARGVLLALLAYIFYSLFNNSFDAVPVSGLMIVIISLMLSYNLEDVKWKRQFSAFSLFYLLLPIFFAFVAYRLQLAHHIEYVNLYRGRILLGASRAKDAANCFAQALKFNPQSLKAIHGAAISFDMLGLEEKSQEMFKNLDLIVPNAFGANYYLAKKLLEKGNILEAHKYALKNLEREHLPSAFELLARVLIIEGKHNEAEAVLLEGLEFIPEFNHEKIAADRGRFTLANYAVNRGEYSQAEKFLDDIKTTYRNDRGVRYLKGMLLVKKEDFKEGLKIFEQLLKEDKNNPVFMNAVGFILTNQGDDLERAQDLLESAHLIIKKRDPIELSNLLMIANSLGKLYWKQNKLNEAGDLLRLAYEQTPEDWGTLKLERKKDLDRFNKQAK